MTSREVRNIVIYARISVKNDESVSIERQVETATKYAEARGWNLLAVITDDGVSASRNRPEDRAGWRKVLELPDDYQAVIIWKIDRLARRTLDFLHADEQLQKRGAAVVCVEQPIDMTSTTGRAFATMLAVFAEMEADAISTRVKAARDYLLRAGRLVGGTVPYGFMRMKNPAGVGYVLARDPATIEFVRGMTDRALDGESVYSIMKWLDEAGAPLPTRSQKNRRRPGWHYSTVERVLRSPVLAGMVPFNPGNQSKVRGVEVLRDDRGLPVVDESIAIISADERRRLIELLDNRDSPQAKPRAGKNVTPPLLSGLATCGHCDRTMHRGTTQGRPSLTCPVCYQVISMGQLLTYLEQRLLSECGEWESWERVPVMDDNAAELTDIEEAIQDVTAKLGRDDADEPALLGQLKALKELRAKARSSSLAQRSIRLRYRGTVRQQWTQTQDDDTRRALLTEVIESIRIVRGKTGRYLDKDRVQVAWRSPDETDDDPTVED